MATYPETKDNAGLVATRRVRATGGLVSVYHAKEAGIAGGEKYVAVCEEHGTLQDAASTADAFSWAAEVTTWCEFCREAHPTQELTVYDTLPETQARLLREIREAGAEGKVYDGRSRRPLKALEEAGLIRVKWETAQVTRARVAETVYRYTAVAVPTREG